MPNAVQLGLPFACLDFPDRDSVTVWEIAAKLRVSRQHILGHIDAGTLTAVDTKVVVSRGNYRIPIDEYRRWLIARLTGPARREFFAELPVQTLRAIKHDIDAILSS